MPPCFVLCGDMQQSEDHIKIIYLPNGLEVRVSYVDWLRFGHLLWHSNGSDTHPYAKRTVTVDGRKTCVYLHREIMQAPKGLVVNHRDGDTLNCTRKNLHVVRHRSNTTKYRVAKGACPYHGVYYRNKALGEVPGKKNVRAAIRVGTDRLRLGSFETAAEAARAYDLAAVDAFGLYADTNFPLTDYICAVDIQPKPENQHTFDPEVPF